MVLRDTRFGETGLGLLVLILSGLVVFSAATSFLIFILISEDFSDAMAEKLTFLASTLVTLYFLACACQLLKEARQVVQSIAMNDEVHVRLYSTSEFRFSPSEILTIRPFKTSRWLRAFTSLLDFKNNNYLIVFRNGRQVYLSGSVGGVSSFIEDLMERSVKETVQCTTAIRIP